MPTSRRHFVVSLAALAAALQGTLAAQPGAPALLLAKVYEQGVDPKPYLVSEKYDGVRAVWDGHVLRHRSGRGVSVPAWFIERLPPIPLDGELWLGRGRFDQLSGIVRKSVPVDAEWREVRYMIFEMPEAEGSFEQRHLRLQRTLADLRQPQLTAVDQSRVGDQASLQRRLDEVVAAGGEGLVLHRADAPYTTGRSDVLLKFKPLRDTEAVVVGVVPGQGKYLGMMGALDVQTPEGLRFRLGTGFSDEQRRHPPPLGATVSYSYRDLTPAGVPRFASFIAVREGL